MKSFSSLPSSSSRNSYFSSSLATGLWWVALGWSVLHFIRDFTTFMTVAWLILPSGEGGLVETMEIEVRD